MKQTALAVARLAELAFLFEVTLHLPWALPAVLLVLVTALRAEPALLLEVMLLLPPLSLSRWTSTQTRGRWAKH